MSYLDDSSGLYSGLGGGGGGGKGAQGILTPRYFTGLICTCMRSISPF